MRNECVLGRCGMRVYSNTDVQATKARVFLTGTRAPPNWGEDYRIAFDRIYPDLARIRGVPLRPFFLQGVQGGAWDPELNQPDRLHPNERGVRVLVTRVTVATWRKRFAAKRLDGLTDEPRPGGPRKIGDEKIAEAMTTTLETMPAAATHRRTRSMAKASGLSISTVHRIWPAFSLQPHRSETFKLSAAPLFVDKVRDIVGLYLNPADTRWCSASMRNRRSRRCIAPSRCSLCDQGKPNGSPVTISGTGRPRSLPPST
jgi:hypothetical protein